jgi:hypothetical protein
MNRFALLLLALFALPMSARAQAGTPPDMPNMQELMKAMGQVMAAASNAPATVDFRALKALLPAELEGMKRTSASGEKTGMMGMNVAYAEGAYQSKEGGSVDIKITDMGGMGGMGGLAVAGWGNVEIDRESDTGYERTTTINGHKAYEKYDSGNKSGQVQIMVGSRFMVEVQGYDVTADALKEAVSKIDLAALAELKPAAPASTPEPPK